MSWLGAGADGRGANGKPMALPKITVHYIGEKARKPDEPPALSNLGLVVLALTAAFGLGMLAEHFVHLM